LVNKRFFFPLKQVDLIEISSIKKTYPQIFFWFSDKETIFEEKRRKKVKIIFFLFLNFGVPEHSKKKFVVGVFILFRPIF